MASLLLVTNPAVELPGTTVFSFLRQQPCALLMLINIAKLDHIQVQTIYTPLSDGRAWTEALACLVYVENTSLLAEPRSLGTALGHEVSRPRSLYTSSHCAASFFD